jgi:hypothetical protein
MSRYTACQYDLHHPPPTYKFAITEIPEFDRDAKHATWFFRTCYQWTLDEFLRIGIPVNNAEFSVQDICTDDEADEDYDGFSSVVYLVLNYQMSANELKTLYDKMTFHIAMQGGTMLQPAMRPAPDYKSEKVYIERTQHWVHQTLDLSTGSHPQIPTGSSGKKDVAQKAMRALLVKGEGF